MTDHGQYEILKRYWGYDSFRELQDQIICSVLEGHDTLGLLPTGGGKSLTFQVPAMLMPGITVVITPLISLMKDQVDNLLQRGIRAYAIHAGLRQSDVTLVYDRMRLGKVKLLYISPERLRSEAFLTRLRECDISLIVVDEAHCISQWGYDFRPSYLEIRKIRQEFPDVPTLALTASATPEVADDIMQQLEFRPDCRKFAKSFDRKNLSYIVRFDDYKQRTLLSALKAVPGCAIVYVRSRRRCREFAEFLVSEGISASYYHAGLDPMDKDERQAAWKDDKTRVMVATNAFGMGIDKPDVRLVVHIDLPPSLEEYYQEAGRAGRDGLPSYALIIVGTSDKATLSRRLSDAFPPKEYIQRVYELLGNYLDVAVGDGYLQTYEFNYDVFCQRFSLQPATTYSALKILSRSGYIDYIDEVHSNSRVQVIARKEEFYGFKLDNVTDTVFAALLRRYTGLFADYVYIRETSLSLDTGLTTDQVYQSLVALSRMHIISYIPQKQTPYVMYTTSREEPRYLLLPTEVYRDRRERMAVRLESVRRFVYDSSTCRSVNLLRYFGQEDAPDCGRCDVCRARAATTASEAKASNIDSDIINAVSASGSIGLKDLLDKYPYSLRNSVVETLRRMADDDTISLSGNTITLKNQQL